MGWLGVVFKADTSRVSEHLAIGPTTGYLGSLTTFSGWNQKMVELIATRHWLLFVLGFLIGNMAHFDNNWILDIGSCLCSAF